MARILVVDDDHAVAFSIRAMLEYEEFEVCVAHTAPSGLEEIEAGGIDLIVVDIFMPGLDGLAMIKAVRADNRAVPIIAITGFVARRMSASEGDVLAQAVAAGATMSMEKPFRRSELVRAVRKCLEPAARGSRLRAGEIARSDERRQCYPD